MRKKKTNYKVNNTYLKLDGNAKVLKKCLESGYTLNIQGLNSTKFYDLYT